MRLFLIGEKYTKKTSKSAADLLINYKISKQLALNGISLLVLLLLCLSCTEKNADNPITFVLENSKEPAIISVMDSLQKYKVQIHFTQIERSQGKIAFKDFTFQEDDSVYFYPASSVKLPVAVLAMEKSNLTKDFGPHTMFFVEGDTIETSIAEEVIKVFAVSDNAANNRMFEFLGQDYINQRLSAMNVGPVRISHRLSTANADDITTKPLIIFLNDSTTTALDFTVNQEISPLQLEEIKKGKGFIDDDLLIEEAFDFSFKNYYPIRTQHNVLKRLIFPENFTESETFKLGIKEREMLLEAMWTPPRFQSYEEGEYYDGYVKFFIYGDTKERIPEHIRIYNKVGYAYGTLTDCAYIIDSLNKVEFLLTATILVNDNMIFNDDQYEYESIGIPFMAALGRELYQYESNRN